MTEKPTQSAPPARKPDPADYSDWLVVDVLVQHGVMPYHGPDSDDEYKNVHDICAILGLNPSATVAETVK